MDPSALTGAINAALVATSAGPADARHEALATAFLEAIKENFDDPRVAEQIKDALGPLVDLSLKPYDELGPLQRNVRDQQHEVDQARESPALSDMQAVYNLLVASSSHRGPSLRLAPGANIVALDEHYRRYLIPSISKATLHRIREATDFEHAERTSRYKGSVRYHWSSERTGLVPEAREIRKTLPLPKKGQYMILYSASHEVAGKKPFADAVRRFAAELPLCDVLFWDIANGIPTLWSVLGGFGHSGGEDVDWPEHLLGTVKDLREHIAASRNH